MSQVDSEDGQATPKDTGASGSVFQSEFLFCIHGSTPPKQRKHQVK